MRARCDGSLAECELRGGRTSGDCGYAYGPVDTAFSGQWIRCKYMIWTELKTVTYAIASRRRSGSFSSAGSSPAKEVIAT